MKERRYCFWLLIIVMLLLVCVAACEKPSEEAMCTVRFDAQYLNYVKTVTVPQGSTLEVPTLFDRTGYDLTEWCITVDGEARAWNFESDVVTEDITLSAVWVPTQYQLYLHPENGEEDIVLSLEYGKPYELPIPVREGYGFYGWAWNQKLQPNSGDFWGFDRAVSFEAKWTNFEPGATVMLGKYEQDGNLDNGPEPIEWIILAKEDGKYLLVSRYLLDRVKMNEKSEMLLWPRTELRHYLNEEFYTSVFTTQERTVICSTYLQDTRCEDKVFLLSYHECKVYFLSMEDAAGEPTAYAKKQGVVSDGYNGSVLTYGYWLRTATVSGGYWIYLVSGSSTGSRGGWAALRPAMWADIEALESVE